MFSVCRDFSVRGPFALLWERGYSSFARRDGPLGFGWTHNFGWHIEARRTELVLHDETLTRQRFPLLVAGESHLGAFDRRLVRVTSGFTLHTRDGLTREFEPCLGRADAWRLSRVSDPSGNRIVLAYDTANRLVELTDTVGRRFRLVYDPNGRITSVDGLNAAAQGRWQPFARYQYSNAGDLVTAVDPGGFARRYLYDDEHRLVRETNRNQLSYHFVYDANGRCVETWGAYDGRHDPALAPGRKNLIESRRGRVPVKGIFHRTFDYQPGRLTEVGDTRGGVRRYFSNALGKVTKQVVAGASNSKEFDALGRLVRAVDAEENVWQYIRDERGRVVEKVDPLGRSTRLRYADATDQPTLVVAPNGGRWEFQYDRRGNTVAATDPLGARTAFRLDERGQRVQVELPTGAKNTVRRDAHALPVSLETPAGTWSMQWDFWGRLLSLKRPDGLESHFAYDDRGLVVSERDARGRVTRFEYDGEENVVAVHRPDGNTNHAVYGGANWITQTTTPDGRTIRLVYDEEGDVVEAHNAAGEISRFEHDVAGRVVAVDCFDGRRITYAYSPLGRKRQRVESDRSVTSYEYDAVGNLTAQKYADGSVDFYRYDELDFVASASNADAQVEYERDLVGRVLREHIAQDDWGYSVESSWDAAGRLTARKLGAHSFELTRDLSGDVVERVFDTQRRQRVERDAMRRVTGVHNPSGASLEWEYEPTGLVTGVRVTRPRSGYVIEEGLTRADGREDVVARAYGYSLTDELAEEVDAHLGATRFSYDPVGRLLERQTTKSREAFAYDLAGNVSHSGEGVNVAPGDRLLQKGSWSLKWDAAGRLIEKSSKSSPQDDTRMVWSGAGMLAEVHRGGAVVTYQYDPFGRRVRKRVKGGEDIRFAWSMNAIAAEIRRRGDVVEERTYVFDEDDVRPLSIHDASGWRDVVTTPAGTPTELVDSEGKITWQARLSSFGAVEEERTHTGSACDLRFGGQLHDRETDLHYNRFRYYDPELQRYISPDPIGLEGGMNEYAYARNPIGWIDPFGLADGAALAANMTGPRPAGHQAHHMIPEELYGPPPHAALRGLSPHEGRNGIYLPTYHDDRVPGGPSTIHRGSHPRFTEHVNSELDRVEAEAQEEHRRTGRPICECRRDGVSQLQDSLRTSLTSGSGSVRSDGGSGLNNANPTRSRPASRPAT